MANVQEGEFIFRGISKSKYRRKLVKKNSPLSYTRAREIILYTLESIGLENKLFGTHSLRSGAPHTQPMRGPRPFIQTTWQMGFRQSKRHVCTRQYSGIAFSDKIYVFINIYKLINYPSYIYMIKLAFDGHLFCFQA